MVVLIDSEVVLVEMLVLGETRSCRESAVSCIRLPCRAHMEDSEGLEMPGLQGTVLDQVHVFRILLPVCLYDKRQDRIYKTREIFLRGKMTEGGCQLSAFRIHILEELDILVEMPPEHGIGDVVVVVVCISPAVEAEMFRHVRVTDPEPPDPVGSQSHVRILPRDVLPRS